MKILEFYENMRVQELAQNIHKLIAHHNLPDLMFRAFSVPPTMVITPYAAFQKELHGQTEEVVSRKRWCGRVNAKHDPAVSSGSSAGDAG